MIASLLYVNEFFTVPGLVTLLGIALGFLYWLYQKGEPKRNEARRFSQAFTLALKLLNDPTLTSYLVVRLESQKHYSAMLAFAHNLEGVAQKRFTSAWNRYEQKYKEVENYGVSIALSELPVQLFEIKRDPEELKRDQTYKEDIKRLIKDLIKAAKK